MIYLYKIDSFRLYGLQELLNAIGISYKTTKNPPDSNKITITTQNKRVLKGPVIRLKTDDIFNLTPLTNREGIALETLMKRFPSHQINRMNRSDIVDFEKTIYRKSEDEFIVKIDISGEIAFHLSRFEELNSQDTDNFDRYLAQNSLIYKTKSLLNPPVDILIDYFTSIMDYICRELNAPIPFLKRWRNDMKFCIIPTVDMDFVRRYPRMSGLMDPLHKFLKFDIRNLVSSIDRIDGILLGTNRAISALERVTEILGKRYTLFIGARFKNFRLMGPDYRLNEPVMNDIRVNIRGEDIETGLHPDFLASGDLQELKKQKNNLELYLNRSVNSLRMHYLRFSVEESIDMLNRTGFKIDSSLGYKSITGYRCGTSLPFCMWNYRDYSKSDIIEVPPVFMDRTFNLENKTIEPQIIDKLEEILDFLAYYGGMGVFIFHYCTFVSGEYLWFKRIVGDFLERVKEYNGDIMSVDRVYKWWNARINSDIFIKTGDDGNIPVLDGDEEVRKYGRVGVLGLYDKGIEIKTNSGKIILKPGDTVRTDILY